MVGDTAGSKMRFLIMTGTLCFALAFCLPFIALFTGAEMNWL